MRASTFVLVPGAWHGGWVWRDVAARLRSQGHLVTTPTLSGLGDRHGEAHARIGLYDHVNDLLAHLFMEDLHDVVLVGWSYGSFVITGAAAQVPERIRAIIYLDAILPSSGSAVADHAAPAVRELLASLVAEGKPLPPMPFDVFGVNDPAVMAHVEPRLVGHPPLTFIQPLPAVDAVDSMPQAFIHCQRTNIPSVRDGYEAFVRARRGKVVVLDADHHCMLTAPEDTVRALVDCLP